MVSRDEVKNAILQLTNGKFDKEFTKTDIQKTLNTKSKSIDKILAELENEKFIKLSRQPGRRKYYVLVPSNNTSTVVKTEVQKEDLDLIKNSLREVLEEYFGKIKDFKDLDMTYDEIKNDLGYVQIKDLREQLGMTLEQFMGKFRDYIIKNYELIPGGKEGIIKGGVLYGIIKRKRR